MTKVLVLDDIRISVESCIYNEGLFELVDLSEEIIGADILNKAINNKVLNINVLYNHFIDDNFQHDFECVHDHQLIETPLTNGVLVLSMTSLDEHHEVIRSHSIELKPL